MFRTVTVTAKHVRHGDIIKVAGTKFEVEAVSTFADHVSITFKSRSSMVRYNALAVPKNEPIKIHQK